jgi:hypothetical protein
VVAGDAGVASADFAAAFVLRAKPTVQFTTDYVDYDGEIIPKAGILLTGDVPITTLYRSPLCDLQKNVVGIS